MSGKEAWDLEELKRQAIELRQQGVRAKEISATLNSGHSAWVVRKWLRDADAIPDERSRVLALWPEKQTHEMAETLKLSQRRVQKMLQ